MKKFTTTDIRSWKPCYDPNRYLAESWKGTVLDILNKNRIPFKDRLWIIMRTDLVSERLMRQFALWCVQQVKHRMMDERSLHALDVMEAYAENRFLIDDPDYAEAWESERSAARDAAEDAWDEAWEEGAQNTTRHALAAWTAARNAAGVAARDASWAAARVVSLATQEQKLYEMLIAGVKTGDTK